MYKALNKQVYNFGNYKITPFRFEDRLDIMKWRNDQIYHLRQKEPLTECQQNNYFNNVVKPQFHHKQPNNILFSFLENDICIGYGGLVHINWTDKNAEISFIMNTDLEKTRFFELWLSYLGMIEQVAFQELQLHKIFIYAFDLRPHLYEVADKFGFFRDATLKEHCFFKNKYIDVVIYSKINNS